MRRQVGDVVVAPNGYSYTYIAGPEDKPQRILTHWLVAEKKYGRKKTAGERVVFIDGKRNNLEPDNVEYAMAANGRNTRAALMRREASLQDRIRELQVELEDVQLELKVMNNGKR
jgi:hypothetical protein